jgi:hypothetical protein
MGRLPRSVEKDGLPNIQKIWWNRTTEQTHVGDRPDETQAWEEIGWVENA